MAANSVQASKPTNLSVAWWNKPDLKYEKLNVDDSFHSLVCTDSTGAVIRDYKGRFLVASTSHTATASMAEGEMHGLNIAIKMDATGYKKNQTSETVGACNGGDRW
jgi:hypothetical protein